MFSNDVLMSEKNADGRLRGSGLWLTIEQAKANLALCATTSIASILIANIWCVDESLVT